MEYFARHSLNTRHRLNYKLIFFVEILAFVSMSFWAAAIEGPVGGLFGRKSINVFGIELSGDFWTKRITKLKNKKE